MSKREENSNVPPEYKNTLRLWCCLLGCSSMFSSKFFFFSRNIKNKCGYPDAANYKAITRNPEHRTPLSLIGTKSQRPPVKHCNSPFSPRLSGPLDNSNQSGKTVSFSSRGLKSRCSGTVLSCGTLWNEARGGSNFWGEILMKSCVKWSLHETEHFALCSLNWLLLGSWFKFFSQGQIMKWF